MRVHYFPGFQLEFTLEKAGVGLTEEIVFLVTVSHPILSNYLRSFKQPIRIIVSYPGTIFQVFGW